MIRSGCVAQRLLVVCDILGDICVIPGSKQCSRRHLNLGYAVMLDRRVDQARLGGSRKISHWSSSVRSSLLICRGVSTQYDGMEEPKPNEDSTDRDRDEKRLMRAKGAALRYIGRRSHSRKELERKMTERGHEADVIRDALDRMQDLGLQDDGEYAAIFARSKWRQSKWSPRKIQMELQRRGVEHGVIENALESVFGEDKAVQVPPPNDCMSAGDDMDQEAAELIAAARRQYQSYGSANISNEAKRRRLIGWLQRRGFTWDTVRAILQSIENDV